MLGAAELGKGCHGYEPGSLPGRVFWPLFVCLQVADTRGSMVALRGGFQCEKEAGLGCGRPSERTRGE